MEGTDAHGRRLALATVVLAAAWVAGTLYWTRTAGLPPDGAAYGVIARNLARGDGYTESFVPFHPGAYESVQHLPDLHGLLTPVLLAPLFAWLGPSSAVVRIPSTLATAATALVVFALGRRLFGAGAAFLAALLTLSSASLFVYSSLGTDDAGFTLLATATLALLAIAVREHRPRLLLAAGLLTAVAILEKPTGIFLPVLGLVAFVALRRRGPLPATALLGLLLPPVLAFGAYVLRNQLAHGSPDFRFGGLEWIWKDSGFEGMMALYERAPSSLETIRRLGLRRVLTITGDQFLWFARSVVALQPVIPARVADVLGVVAVPAFLPALAFALLPWLRRREPIFAALVPATALAAAAIVCTLWHAEPRYFAVLIPLSALVIAGTLASRSRLGMAVVAALVLVSALGLVAAARALDRRPHFCPVAVEWMVRNGGEGRVLTFDPWTIAWVADRETVMIPSGGVEAIAQVARRYDARLLLAHHMIGRPETSRLVARLEGLHGNLRVTTLYTMGPCRIARIEVLYGEPAP